MTAFALAFEGGQDVRLCAKCGGNSFHDAKRVMVFSPSGARFMWLWSCETHPLPDYVAEDVR